MGDEHEEEFEGEEEEDEKVVQPIYPRVIEVLDVLVEEIQEDVVKQSTGSFYMSSKSS